jgi:hypothetical protein
LKRELTPISCPNFLSVIPDPIPLDRVVADNPEPTYVTFINPQPCKGMTVFVRIAMELNRKRPDNPLSCVYTPS